MNLALALGITGGVILIGSMMARGVTWRPVPGDRLLLVGDSHGLGLGRHFRALTAKDGIDFESIAVGGTAIFQWARDRSRVGGRPVGIGPILDRSPSVVLVTLGTNDGNATEDQIDWETPMLEKFVRKIAASGAKIVWMLPPWSPVRNLDKALSMIRSSPAAAEAGVFFHEAMSMQPPVAMSSDRIHASPKGYEDWAKGVWSWMREGVPV